MKFHNLETGIYAVVNESATGIKSRIGSLVLIYDYLTTGNYDYIVQFQDKNITKVKESELIPIDENDPIIKIKLGDYVIKKNGQSGKVVKIDYLHKQIEIEFGDKTYEVVNSYELTKDVHEVGKEDDNMKTSEPKFNIGDKVFAVTDDSNEHISKVTNIYNSPINGYIYFVELKDGSELAFDEEDLEFYEGLNEGQQDEQEIGRFEKLGIELGKFTDDKDRQYSSSVDAAYEVIKVLMNRYTYDEEQYLIPKSLLKHILLQVRMIDKLNRIFNNPSGKDEKESPYRDLTGYSLIGVDMVERNKS